MQVIYQDQHIIQVIEPKWHPSVVLSNQEILNALACHIKRDYRLMLLDEYLKRELKPNAQLVFNRFGSWRGAMQAIGLDVNYPGLRSRYKEIRYMTAKLLVHKRFGTCDPPDFSILRMERWKVRNPSFVQIQHYTNTELLQVVIQHIKEDYRLVVGTEYKQSGRKPAYVTVCARFGSWRAAMEKIGFNMNHPGLRSKKREKRLQAAREITNEFFERQTSSIKSCPDPS
jgi:hypothetical protein